MELSTEQKEALDIAVSRYEMGYKYTCIAGYAGTGKSTIVKVIIDALGFTDEEVAYVAFTGKAAEVLRQKGCPNACTAHKLLYYSAKTIEGNYIFKPKTSLDPNLKLIVVDEISMLDVELWNLLIKHRPYVIALGDPFQIPPINPEHDNHVLDNPHAFLKTIFRQAADSEIITLSMDIRNFKNINYDSGKEVMVMPYRNVVEGVYTWPDQILTATNKKRKEVNSTVRKLKGFTSPEPQVGDKVISLENHWDILDIYTGESALVNGTIGYIETIEEKNIIYNIRPGFSIGPISVYSIIIKTEIDEYFETLIDKKYILTGEKTLTPKQEFIIYQSKKRKMLPEVPCLFDFGYAITTHRAQGSQWNKVLVFEEGFPFDKEEHARWVYTACTRPSEKLVLVR